MSYFSIWTLGFFHKHLSFIVYKNHCTLNLSGFNLDFFKSLSMFITTMDLISHDSGEHGILALFVSRILSNSNQLHEVVPF